VRLKGFQSADICAGLIALHLHKFQNDLYIVQYCCIISREKLNQPVSLERHRLACVLIYTGGTMAIYIYPVIQLYAYLIYVLFA
jgi:hypothetical protein